MNTLTVTPEALVALVVSLLATILFGVLAQDWHNDDSF